MTVNPVNNDAPTNIALSSTTVNENEAINTQVGQLSGSDPDGNISNYQLVGGDQTKFNINGTQLRTSEKFDYETDNSYSVTIRVTDTTNLTYEKVFTIGINNMNETPTITSGTPSNVQQYQTLSNYYTVVASNPYSNDNNLVFSLTSYPSGMSINSSSGVISWNVGTASTGTVSFTVKVLANNSEYVTKTYTVNVAEGTFTFPNRTQLLNAIASLGGGCSHSTYGNINDWDVTAITDMNGLFANTSFNCNISSWDVSNVTNMAFMFSYNSSFNQPLNSWDVGNVTNMNWMFGYNSAFNQALNNWDVRNVVTFHAMFYEATSFNQPLNQWNLQGGVFDGSWGHRIDMESMFKYATSFNQNLSAWDVRSVKSMDSMFESATSFNNGGHDIRNWRPSGCQTMMEMFKNAHSFNQSVDEWAPYLDNVETAQDAFHYTNLIKERRDDILNEWLEDPDNFKIKNNWNSSYKENKNCWPWNECESFKLSNYGL